jgi:hypothetical protein
VLKATSYQEAAKDEKDRNSMLSDAVRVGDMQSAVESNSYVARDDQRESRLRAIRQGLEYAVDSV